MAIIATMSTLPKTFDRHFVPELRLDRAPDQSREAIHSDESTRTSLSSSSLGTSYTQYVTASSDESVRKQLPLPTPNAKRKSSLFSLFTLKDPSTQAFAEYQAETQREAARRAGVVVTGSRSKLPSNVPRVNSKWDGMPKGAKADALRMKDEETESIDCSVPRQRRPLSMTSTSSTLQRVFPSRRSSCRVDTLKGDGSKSRAGANGSPKTMQAFVDRSRPKQVETAYDSHCQPVQDRSRSITSNVSVPSLVHSSTQSPTSFPPTPLSSHSSPSGHSKPRACQESRSHKDLFAPSKMVLRLPADRIKKHTQSRDKAASPFLAGEAIPFELPGDESET